ncbi:MAG: hypothetical protein RL095_830 [Verrucomicrobiota bacterium]|jgi:hypothetical protein
MKAVLPLLIFAPMLFAGDPAQGKKNASEAVEMPAMEPASPPPQETDLLKDGLKNWFFDRKGVDISSVAKIEAGVLKLSGKPVGSLISRAAYKDYEIEVEWRWPGKPGNGGVLPHVSTPNQIGVWPRSMECQILNGRAAEFLAIPRALPFEARPGPNKGGVAKRAAEAAEKPLGEWNNMRIQCRGNAFKIWLNGVLANECSGWPDAAGPFALQNEGTPYEYRKVIVRPLPKE